MSDIYYLIKDTKIQCLSLNDAMDPVSRGPELAQELGCVVPSLLRIISSKHSILILIIHDFKNTVTNVYLMCEKVYEDNKETL